jgi:hypothetical protein
MRAMYTGVVDQAGPLRIVDLVRRLDRRDNATGNE